MATTGSPGDGIAKGKSSDTGLLFLRTVVAALVAPCGIVAAVQSLQIHWSLSNHHWQSRRYYMDLGGSATEISDNLVVAFLASIIFFRLGWLVFDAVVALSGRRIPWMGLAKADVYFLLVPMVMWGYFMYVANVKDKPFWPVGVACLALCVIPIVWRFGPRRTGVSSPSPPRNDAVSS